MSIAVQENNNSFIKSTHLRNFSNKFLIFQFFIFVLSIGFILGAVYERSITTKKENIAIKANNEKKIENLLTDDPVFSKLVYSPSKKFSLLFLSKTVNNNLETVNNVLVGTGPYKDTLVYSVIGGGAGGPSISDDPKIWSPDEKYFYINESYPDFVNILVFRSDGKQFANNQQYLDVSKALLAQTGYIMNNGETWISGYEISFKTYKQGTLKWPNYIFNVENQTFKPE
jgi:hypothetical protein